MNLVNEFLLDGIKTTSLTLNDEELNPYRASRQTINRILLRHNLRAIKTPKKFKISLDNRFKRYLWYKSDYNISLIIKISNSSYI